VILIIKCVYLTTTMLYTCKYGSTRSRRVCTMFGCAASKEFIVKSLLKDSPLFYILTTFCALIFIFGWIFMVAESPGDRIHHDMMRHNYWNSCWEAICTMSTVGYGDIYPRTFAGRITSLCAAIFGVVLISLLVVTLSNTLAFGGPEANAFTVLRRLECREMIKDVALKLLITINKKHDPDLNSEMKRFLQIKFEIENFRRLRRIYRNIGEVTMVDE
jgi:hypothetical protein